MADRTHDHVDPDDAEQLAISAALDDEGPGVDAPSADGREFESRAEQIRRRVRVTTAEPVPDLTDAVLAELEPAPTTDRTIRWRAIAAVAAAFVVGVAASATFLLDRNLESTDVAAADISRELVRAQSSLTRLDATLVIVERGVHPAVPERTYAGTLTYQSPEQLAVTITDTTTYPSADWIPNNIQLVVDDDVAWRTRGLGCPVDTLPTCLGPTDVDAIVGRAPFSEGWAAPLDLIVPAGDLIEDDVEADILGERVRVTTTVREARSLVDSLLRNGAFRQVHATDTVTIELDAETLGLRALAIRASDAPARQLWATTWGYDDPTDAVLLELSVAPTGDGLDLPSTPPVTPSVDAGFRPGPVDDTLTPGRLPAGLALHRSGVQTLPGNRVDEIASWSDGRAWIAVRSSPGDGRVPSATAERQSLANGIGYVDRVSGDVELFVGDRRYRVTGSLPMSILVDAAATLPVAGVGVDVGHNDDVPAGVLVPPVVRSIDVRGDTVTIVTSTDDGAIVTITQRPGDRLAPPRKTDSFEAPTRGTVARFSSAFGTLLWVENGWVVELHSSTAAAEQLVELAASLRPAT